MNCLDMLTKKRTLSLLLSLLTLVSEDLVSARSAQGSTLSPRQAPPGTVVVITDGPFGLFHSPQANRVTFNGVPALIQYWDANRIEVRVPHGATSGPVQICHDKESSTIGTMTITQPAIHALEPAEAEPGETIRIIGKGFGENSGPKVPNIIFGTKEVMIGGVSVQAQHWEDELIELTLPANATSGPVSIRLGSFDPLPDGSCCAPTQYLVSNEVHLSLLSPVRVDPLAGPVGTKFVLFGQGFAANKEGDDLVLINGKPATIARWEDTMIVAHVPLEAESGPIVLQSQGRKRTVATFTVHTSKPTLLTPVSAPIGTLLTIRGEHFGSYSESGATPYNFLDFNTGENRVEIGGVRAVVYRWNDDRIDVWVPFSAKSGKVMLYRTATEPHPDGSCCATQDVVATEVGDFTLVTPSITSYEPKAAGLDASVTIKGTGFGSFLKTAEHAHLGINQKAYKRREDVEINDPHAEGMVLSNVSRTEVLFNGTAAVVESWTDTEIVVQVPRRNLYGIGKRGEFFDNLATGPLMVRRGSWDVLPDGTCCTPKQWLTMEAGPFTIEATGLPDTDYWTNNRPDANTNQ
ncbi:MAG: IPT/TIG domain-containing protein [Nitrospira sp.]|nr:IPT/TIG domain-containing protein [Nitrospira sp.]